ncbi:sulfatase-like hydrolase/transferase [Lacipirellula limnantheis]|uniref:Arylsulfatase n=1 Tax=Lacipirellula limnantheis TaxID=2528024 RepID=A0A517U4W6_9BACT|nr:sulfatase-like hydrolase/transferase [Lacipirellula limnantheis]QDT75600.1 Arylsulfatase [Lacipirellula limnantheis]
MTRVRYARLAAAIYCSMLIGQGRADESAPPAVRPNVILILADDLGVNDLGCYGRRDHQTPHLDQLASEGVRFACAYTAQPICSPSRAALMTGKAPARLHLTNFLPGRPDAPSQRLLQPRIEGQLPLEETTVAELLQQAGYATGLFGKWHLGGPGFGPEKQGFETAVSPPANTPPTLADGGKGEGAITAAAEEFIAAHRNEPFFCYVAHNNPHIPLAAAPELVAEHGDAFHPVYAAMIETLDDSVGRLMKHVDDLGLSERTIFIFTSDNGGLHVLESPGTPATHNTPFRAGKGYLYEGGLREPLLIRWPGVAAAGSVCESPVVLTDLVPTILAAAGIDVATTVGPLDGVSMIGLLRGEPLPPRQLYWHFPNYTNQGSRPASAIREGEWKLVEQLEDASVELFDLANDPSETMNLAAANPDRVDDLRRKLHAWRDRMGAQMPTTNPDFDAALHRRLYIEQDPSRLPPETTAAATGPNWKAWRTAMNKVREGAEPAVTPAAGDIRLHARDAIVHAKTMRYEAEPHKNVLGYWTDPADWAEWEFDVPEAGEYEVEIQQGCGDGSGGALVAVEVGGERFEFTVQETGHFQQMILRTIGQVKLAAGRQRLAIKPQTKPGPAVMDVRRVVLRPIALP